ncbi:MAG: hypothetical protein E7626_00475 [Ruminococcaceae bacterium]|nr:hypothetical protein [Oscillospiraceae bacterium]
MNGKKNSIFAGDFDRIAWGYTLVFALIVPLVCTLILSPFVGMLQANNFGGEVVYEILRQLSALLANVAFFAECAVIICCMLARKDALAWKLFWCEVASLLVIAVFLKRGVLWLGAVIDEFVLSEIGSFAISNYTLAHIHGEHPMAETSMLPAFLDVCALVFALSVGVVGVKIRINSMKKRGRKIGEDTLLAGMPENKIANMHAAVSIIALLAINVISHLSYVSEIIAQDGAPKTLSAYVFIALPVVYKLAFAVVGYFVCQYVLYVMVSRLEKSEKVKKRR